MAKAMKKKGKRVVRRRSPVDDILGRLFASAATVKAQRDDVAVFDREAWDTACADICAAFLAKSLKDDAHFVSPVPPETIIRTAQKFQVPRAKKLLAPYYKAAGGPCTKQGCHCRMSALITIIARSQRTMAPEQFFTNAERIVTNYLANRS